MESIMAICEFYEMMSNYPPTYEMIVCVEGGRRVLVFGFELGLPLCIGCQVLVLLGIGMGWECKYMYEYPFRDY